MKTIGIIGGGASGMMAALSAAQTIKGSQIFIYEQKESLGKKILATGNGRCNLTNTQMAVNNYHGKNPNFVEYAIHNYPPEKIITYFQTIGIYCKYEYGGRVFPNSMQASTVQELLIKRINHEKITIITNTKITDIEKKADTFQLTSQINGKEKNYKHDKIIIACGGKSSPQLGSDGMGFKILEKLGHKIITPVPALTQFKTDLKTTKTLNGTKTWAKVSAYAKNQFIGKTKGDVLFTKYGLSGTAILDISGICYEHNNIHLKLDFVDKLEKPKLIEMLIERQKKMGYLNPKDFLEGLVHKKLGNLLTKEARIHEISSLEYITKKQIECLANLMKEYEIKVTGHNGWANSQVTAGGADTANFDAKTMESLLIFGLYCVGEALDIFGDCGGYNLHWAWASGLLGGKSAASSLV